VKPAPMWVGGDMKLSEEFPFVRMWGLFWQSLPNIFRTHYHAAAG
jgi:hypothetical protein